MPNQIDRNEIARIVQEEISQYVGGSFSMQDHLQAKLHLLSDDLSAIVLTLERRFQVKIERSRYRTVFTAADLADLFSGELNAEGL